MQQSPWYSIAAIFVSMLVMGILGFAYTNHVQRTNDQKWCGLIAYLDDGYRAAPPTTNAGKEFARRISVMRENLHCE
jgi:hypothetical protein